MLKNQRNNQNVKNKQQKTVTITHSENVLACSQNRQTRAFYTSAFFSLQKSFLHCSSGVFISYWFAFVDVFNTSESSSSSSTSTRRSKNLFAYLFYKKFQMVALEKQQESSDKELAALRDSTTLMNHRFEILQKELEDKEQIIRNLNKNLEVRFSTSLGIYASMGFLGNYC